MESFDGDYKVMVTKLGEKTFSLSKGNSFFTVHLNLSEKAIELKIKKKLSPNTYEGIFTYEEFLKIHKLFYIFDTLEDIYCVVKDKMNTQNVDLIEDLGVFTLIMMFDLDTKKQKVNLVIPKNPEVDVSMILDDMSNNILSLEERVQKLERNVTFMEESTIVPIQDVDMIKKWIDDSGNYNISFTLLYKASLHGDRSSDFHSKCDNQGPTISFVETLAGKKFGGYTTLNWDSSGAYKTGDSAAFVFSIDRKKKFKIIDSNRNAIYCHASYNVTFGDGHDFYVGDYIGNAGSYSNFPYAYSGQDLEFKPNTYLSGAYHFTAKDVEVYSVTKNSK